MKKLLTACLTLSILLTAQLQAYAATGWPTYSVDSNVAAVRGETVTVPISVSNNPGFTSVGLVVSYNPNVLEIKNVYAAQSAMPLNSQFALTSTPGTQWIHLINTGLVDWTGNGVVANVTFTVKASAPDGASSVSLSFTGSPDGTPANANGDILTDARVSSGSVYVSDTGTTSKYPVIYNLNGGSGATPVEPDKDPGEKFYISSAAGIVAPLGTQFLEWNTSSNGSGTRYNPGDIVTMTAKPLTLYAIWTELPAYVDATSTVVDTAATTDISYTPTNAVNNAASTSNLPQTGVSSRLVWSLLAAGILMLVVFAGVNYGRKNET